MMSPLILAFGALALAHPAAAEAALGPGPEFSARISVSPVCDADNGGLALPDGFCALVVVDDVGGARHLVVAANGDVFVAVRGSRRTGTSGGVVGLRDTDGDGKADTVVRFAEEYGSGGTGIALYGGHLYFAHDGGVVRAPLPAGALEPTGLFENVVAGLPGPGTSHAAKSAVIDDQRRLFVNIGSPSNTCQEEDRQVGSPGQDPCPQLETRAGVWMFDANGRDQTQADGVRFATGLRNTFALAVHPATGQLWGVQHGRDQLTQNWPELFDEEQNAERPAEEFVQLDEGDDFGWPYCYYDPVLRKKVLAPEYGGDGGTIGRCTDMKDPAIGLPGHWGPNGLTFYTGEMFPPAYRGGAFIAFHGSWNRAPLPQGGYNVVFVPFGTDGQPTGEWEVFADEFAGKDKSPRGAAHRPSGVAVGPDGSLYIADDRGGRIYRVLYRG
jgi:glucose/arabinose dehydrogenase